jgi:hypothetical protein
LAAFIIDKTVFRLCGHHRIADGRYRGRKIEFIFPASQALWLTAIIGFDLF